MQYPQKSGQQSVTVLKSVGWTSNIEPTSQPAPGWGGGVWGLQNHQEVDKTHLVMYTVLKRASHALQLLLLSVLCDHAQDLSLWFLSNHTSLVFLMFDSFCIFFSQVCWSFAVDLSSDGKPWTRDNNKENIPSVSVGPRVRSDVL